MTAPRYTPAELLAVMGSRQLRDDTTVFAGVGVPLLAAVLAQHRHAPRLTLVIEGGIIGPRIEPGRLPVSTNEMRAARHATMLPGITATFLLAQRGFLDCGFIGGAQIDRHGNLNTSAIGRDYWKLVSLCKEVIVLTLHERRRFVETVDFVTSPGYLAGGDSRRQAGLLFGRVSRVVTTLGLFSFDPDDKRLRLDALHPGVTRDAVAAETGFEVLMSERVEATEPPAEEELSLLRAIDPERRFLA